MIKVGSTEASTFTVGATLPALPNSGVRNGGDVVGKVSAAPPVVGVLRPVVGVPLVAVIVCCADNAGSCEQALISRPSSIVSTISSGCIFFLRQRRVVR